MPSAPGSRCRRPDRSVPATRARWPHGAAASTPPGRPSPGSATTKRSAVCGSTTSATARRAFVPVASTWVSLLFRTHRITDLSFSGLRINSSRCASRVGPIQQEHSMQIRFRRVASIALAVSLAVGAASVMAQVMVGGAPMLPTQDIIDNAVNSKDHTTLVAAVKAAGLVDTLKGTGPFSVFAPTNEAFAALPTGTVDTLLKPENKGKLAAILTYHVVP